MHPVEYVKVFHKTYGAPISDVPVIPPADRRLLRVKLILEEAAEFAKASGFPVQVMLIVSEEGDGVLRHMIRLEDATVDMDQPELIDIVEAADAMGDINVVTNGSALEWGIPIQEVDHEIHLSNQSKLGEEGKPIKREDGKVLKGPNYFKPRILEILKRYGWGG